MSDEGWQRGINKTSEEKKKTKNKNNNVREDTGGDKVSMFFVFNSSLNILRIISQQYFYLDTLHYLKVGRDKYWMLPRELGKCFPYSKVPPRVCSRKSRDKGADAAFGGN